jgi:hypothetical protein
MSDVNDEMADVQAWFHEKGFRVDVREEAGVFWADMISLATLQVLAPKYGRGDSAAAASYRAKERFRQEQ